MSRRTRREALRAGAGLVAGIWAGPATAVAGAAAGPPTDGSIVVAAVALEQRSALAYRMAARSGLLRPRLQGLAERFAGQEAEHLGAMRTALEALGRALPPPPETVPQLAAASSEAAVAEYLLRLESASVSAYQRALASLTVPNLVRTAASVMAVEAQQLAMIRAALGRESVRGPFERG